MRAWVLRHGGLPNASLKLESDFPTPTPNPKKELLIKIKYASLNPYAYQVMNSLAKIPFLFNLPMVSYECDFSGIVEGGELGGFKEGDEVYGIIPPEWQFRSGHGTLAEYTVCRPSLMRHKPPSLSFAEAASVPLAAGSAYLVLVKLANIQKGQRVLVNGASGGVGIFAIQIAKALGAFVVCTCSDATRELVESLGPDVTINYKTTPLAPYLTEHYSSATERFDLIFDIIGVDQLYRAASSFVVPKTGQYIELGGPPAHTARQNASNIGRLLSKSYLPSLLGGGIKFNHPTYFPSKGCEKGGVLDGVHRLVEEGKIKPIIDSEFDMDDALKAYDRLMSSRAKGKVVVKIQ